ncbi:nuclear transport factor 2 family protein [Comamonas guangdongensis]|uniref:Nuclear transport factor 2 family protein n=1 Tax=Comamonas guangdongensis TaxID=510515 RepID=A0ABV3ZQD7_9BURK
MTLQSLADKLEINELLARYCHALDLGDWQAFAALFTPDAALDFTAFGGPKGTPAQLQAFFAPILGGLKAYQHTVSTVVIELQGDCAKARSAAMVPMTRLDAEGREQTFMSGLWYEDELVRTGLGWQIKARTQVRSWAAALA